MGPARAGSERVRCFPPGPERPGFPRIWMKLTRSYNPKLWQTLEVLGLVLGCLAVQAGRGRGAPTFTAPVTRHAG